MTTVRRTTSDDPAFQALVGELDEDLRHRYGAKQSQYDVHNVALEGARVVIAMQDDKPVGCGCFKPFGQDGTAELKRMYVQSGSRRLGVARQLLVELERWAAEQGYAKTILQTATKQPEAIALYRNCGYQPIDNYGVYVGDEDSVCLEKQVRE